jgi:gamma-glutamyltranspeptidase/glutathione hydrolase
MLSSMTPTIVLQSGNPYLVVGTPGGTTIPTSVFQTILNVLDFNMSPSDAVNQPKFHHQWLPDLIMVENEFNANTKAALETMGYKVIVRGNIGRTELIIIDRSKGQAPQIKAVGDKRGDDAAEGF